jgi:hypothetical protein
MCFLPFIFPSSNKNSWDNKGGTWKTLSAGHESIITQLWPLVKPSNVWECPGWTYFELLQITVFFIGQFLMLLTGWFPPYHANGADLFLQFPID